jgi:hypothetical protein
MGDKCKKRGKTEERIRMAKYQRCQRGGTTHFDFIILL